MYINYLNIILFKKQLLNINVFALYIYIPQLYSALYMQGYTIKGDLHAATKVQVHPLLAQIQSDLTRGTDETKPPKEEQIDTRYKAIREPVPSSY